MLREEHLLGTMREHGEGERLSDGHSLVLELGQFQLAHLASRRGDEYLN